jgi:hypothetical protein
MVRRSRHNAALRAQALWPNTQRRQVALSQRPVLPDPLATPALTYLRGQEVPAKLAAVADRNRGVIAGGIERGDEQPAGEVV